MIDAKIINLLLILLLGLGSWNLHQTFSLSNEMVLVKEKINQIEKRMDYANNDKPKYKKKKKKKNNNNKG